MKDTMLCNDIGVDDQNNLQVFTSIISLYNILSDSDSTLGSNFPHQIFFDKNILVYFSYVPIETDSIFPVYLPQYSIR